MGLKSSTINYIDHQHRSAVALLAIRAQIER